MQISQRKIGILLNYANEAVKIVTALVYTPLMLRILGQSEYGLYQLVSSTVAYLSLLSLGFSGAYVRYHSRYQVKEDEQGVARLNGMFLLVFCAMSLLCIVCGSFMVANARLLFGNGLTAAELKKAKILLAILVAGMTLTFPKSVFNCYITAHEAFFFQKILQLAQNMMNPFLALPLLLMGHGSIAVVLVSAVLTLVTLLLDIWFCVKRLSMKISFWGMQFSLLKEMFAFTFFIFLNQIVDQANWGVDKFLLGRISGTEAVAVYGIGGQINSLYVQMSLSISGVFAPQINKIVASSDDNVALTNLMIKVGRIQFILIALIMTGFIFFGRPFIRLWAGEGYEQAYWVAFLLMLPMTGPLIQNIGIEIQRAKNKHQVRSVVYFCLALCNILLSIPLIRKWGCVGAAAGTAISLIAGNVVFMNWYYHRHMGLNMYTFWKNILPLLVSTLIASLGGWALAAHVEINGWGTFAVCVALYTLLYGVVIWFVGLNEYEKQTATGILNKLQSARERNG